MPVLRPPVTERRRDPRFALTGSARLVVRQPLHTVEGALEDVSAGGVRFALGEGVGLTLGQAVEVEVLIRDVSDPARPPTIQLKGTGSIVRRHPPTGAGPCQLAVHLSGPLGFREYFSQVRVF